jgi:hypothetical protein
MRSLVDRGLRVWLLINLLFFPVFPELHVRRKRLHYAYLFRLCRNDDWVTRRNGDFIISVPLLRRSDNERSGGPVATKQKGLG